MANAQAKDRRDLDVLKALGEIDLPKTKFWSEMGLPDGDDIEFRVLHGSRDALIIDQDRFKGLARMYLFLKIEEEEGSEDKMPLIIPIRYEGTFDPENGKPQFKKIMLDPSSKDKFKDIIG